MPLQLQGQSLLLPAGQQSPLRHQKWLKGHIPLRCRQNGGHDCGRVEVDAVHARRDVLLSATALVLSPWAASVRAADDMQKMHVPIDKLKDIIADDFQNGQYYITGHLTTGVFASDCSFKDPTTNVKGPDVYSRAVALLFDQSTSRADLIDIEVTDPHTITSRWRFDAALNFPGKPRIKPYTGTTKYVINDEGLVQAHVETWDISTVDAFVSIFVPTFGAPPAPPV